MKILYGISIEKSIDVTDICFSKLNKNNIISIPKGDYQRASHFSDPFNGFLKKIMIINDKELITEYDQTKQIKINILNNTIESICENEIDRKIEALHSKLQIRHGNIKDELSEQKMVVRYLTGKEKVLEIGGNIGRNSLAIASILQDDRNLVTLESDPNSAKQLEENRDLNNFHFHIEDSALSKRKLIQKGWDTIPSEILKEGYFWVKTITLSELKAKYDIEFDTLVLDCEGAFYYILVDMPEILNNVNLIIMENDYHDISNKNYVDRVLKENNFYLDYQEGGGWGPCSSFFFEVWKK